jgi:hypothetical protein
MKKETDSNAWLRIVLIVGAIAFSLASNDDYETSQRVRVTYQTK